MERDVLGLNPDLQDQQEAMHLIASGPSRVNRPFPICNMAMFLDGNRCDFNYLSPVQSTPFITGILGTPEGTDANGRRPGGGGVTSFGFASEPRGTDQGFPHYSTFDTRLDPTEVNLLASLTAWIVGTDGNVERFRGLYKDRPSG